MMKLNWSRGWRFILVAVGCFVLTLLIMDFNNRMAELRRLNTEKEQVAGQVTSLVETQYALQTQVAYATSEAAVYRWAYEYRRLTRPGEQLVVPIQPAGSTPIVTPVPTSTPEVIRNWQVWLSLLMDQP
jgi:hypothetical protein